MPEPFTKPYLDASVYIAAIKREAGRYEIAERILRDAAAGKLEIVASTFVIAEVIKGPTGAPMLTPEQERVIDGFFQHDFITWVELDMTVAYDARRLARLHGLKPADAVHLASAIRGRADQLLRWDDRMKVRLTEGQKYEGVVVCEPHLVGRPEQLPGIEEHS